jgi:prepilin-type N-terminal cleavage/methylation domain-containing protein
MTPGWQNPPKSPLGKGGRAGAAPFFNGEAGGIGGWGPRRFPRNCREGLTQDGFTLLELMAVLGLMALIMALVLPGLRQSYGRERDRANLRGLVVALRAARSEAATNRHRVRVFLDLQTGQYRLEGSPQRGQLTGMKMSDVRLVWQDQVKQHGYVAFYGDGSSSGGRLRLVDPAGVPYKVEVEVITGRVTLRSGES